MYARNVTITNNACPTRYSQRSVTISSHSTHIPVQQHGCVQCTHTLTEISPRPVHKGLHPSQRVCAYIFKLKWQHVITQHTNTCITYVCTARCIHKLTQARTQISIHVQVRTSTVHRHSGPRLTCGQTLVLENLSAASSSGETPHNVALPDWGAAICGRYRQQKIQKYTRTHTMPPCAPQVPTVLGLGMVPLDTVSLHSLWWSGKGIS